jgi:hypothetical protein
MLTQKTMDQLALKILKPEQSYTQRSGAIFEIIEF